MFGFAFANSHARHLRTSNLCHWGRYGVFKSYFLQNIACILKTFVIFVTLEIEGFSTEIIRESEQVLLQVLEKLQIGELAMKNVIIKSKYHNIQRSFTR